MITRIYELMILFDKKPVWRVKKIVEVKNAGKNNLEKIP